MGSAPEVLTPQMLEPIELRVASASAQHAAHGAESVTLEQLGVQVPATPGDVGLCGQLPKGMVRVVGQRYASWVCLNTQEGGGFLPEELRAAGVHHVEFRHFPGPSPPPSQEQVAAAIDALDRLPRPLMLQCTSGRRAAALLSLWLDRKHDDSNELRGPIAEATHLKGLACAAAYGSLDQGAAPPKDHKAPSGLSFLQLFDTESFTFTYLLGCEETKEAVLIDPVLGQKARDLAVVRELGLDLRFVVNTHAHADHVTSGSAIRAELPVVRTVISQASGARADVLVESGDTVAFGRFALEAIATPGHTLGCITWLLQGSPHRVFTGDSLLIRGCGRTDFQGGDAGMLHDSVTTKLFTLPGETMVYPGHDYRGRASSTIDQEKSFNWRFTKTRGEFVSYMSRLNLPCPKCLDVVVAANLSCGALDMREVEESIASQPELGIHVPDRPGDIGLCGDLPKEALKKIAGRYASWVYLNMKSNPAFMPEELKSAGVQSLEVWPFPSQFLPSEANTRGALAALDKLPRPLMLQCSGGNRAGALLLLWLAKKQGYTAESAPQLAMDLSLKFWTTSDQVGHYRAWVLEQLSQKAAPPIMLPRPIAVPVVDSPVQRLPVRLSETVAVRDSPSCLALTQSQLGVEVPAMPGDVGLCGALSKETLEAVARRYTSWVYLNTSSDPDFMPDVLKRFGVKAIEVRTFRGPQAPDSEEEAVAAAIEALERLPRPLMLQCSTGSRAGALLLLWFAKKYSYCMESVPQLAKDMSMKFWAKNELREWVLDRMSAKTSTEPATDSTQSIKDSAESVRSDETITTCPSNNSSTMALTLETAQPSSNAPSCFAPLKAAFIACRSALRSGCLGDSSPA